MTLQRDDAKKVGLESPTYRDAPMFGRLPQVVLCISIGVACWLGMMAVHELGHTLAAWATGGTVVKVVLHPLTISRTDILPNPHPLLVVWAGPIGGVILPLAIWAATVLCRFRWSFVTRFFAGFCLIANGAYIGVGSFDRVGDAGDMLRHGSPIELLWAFGLLTVPSGLWLWHGQGRHFGFGDARGQVDRSAAWMCLIFAIVLAATLSLFGD